MIWVAQKPDVDAVLGVFLDLRGKVTDPCDLRTRLRNKPCEFDEVDLRAGDHVLIGDELLEPVLDLRYMTAGKA